MHKERPRLLVAGKANIGKEKKEESACRISRIKRCALNFELPKYSENLKIIKDRIRSIVGSTMNVFGLQLFRLFLYFCKAMDVSLDKGD